MIANDEKFFMAVLAGLAIVVLVFIFALSQGRTPETYTAAWIEESPLSVNENTDFPFTFAIQCNEESETAYTYKITADEKTIEKAVTLRPGETKTIEETVSLSMPPLGYDKKKVTIEINKPGKEQPYELWFWVRVSEQ